MRQSVSSVYLAPTLQTIGPDAHCQLTEFLFGSMRPFPVLGALIVVSWFPLPVLVILMRPKSRGLALLGLLVDRYDLNTIPFTGKDKRPSGFGRSYSQYWHKSPTGLVAFRLHCGITLGRSPPRAKQIGSPLINTARGGQSPLSSPHLGLPTVIDMVSATHRRPVNVW